MFFTRRPSAHNSLETNRNHLAMQCAGITFQRKMTPTIGTMTAFCSGRF